MLLFNIRLIESYCIMKGPQAFNGNFVSFIIFDFYTFFVV